MQVRFMRVLVGESENDDQLSPCCCSGNEEMMRAGVCLPLCVCRLMAETLASLELPHPHVYNILALVAYCFE